MKKTMLLALVLSLLLCSLTACGGVEKNLIQPSTVTTAETTTIHPIPLGERFQVALIMDREAWSTWGYDLSPYHAASEWCETYDIPFQYYSPTEDSTEGQVVAIESAIREGANVLILNGFSFAGAVVETADKYPEVYYIALGVGESDLQDAWGMADRGTYVCPSNVYAATYREEIAGFLAGYAAVKMGYRSPAYMGAMAVPADQRYAYGFIQGADHAAGELGAEVTVRQGQALWCSCSGWKSAIAPTLEKWHNAGSDIFMFGNKELFLYAIEKENVLDYLKIIGIEKDQKGDIEGLCGEGIVATSAVNNGSATIVWALSQLILEDHWEALGGKVESLGLVSSRENEKNHVCLPTNSTQWNDSFTKDDYSAILEDILTGKVVVDSSIDQPPQTKYITVDYTGNIPHVEQES